MRTKAVIGIWLSAITLAWMAVLPADLGVSPLVDAQGAATGWWQLRQQAVYLSGLWSIGLMALAMVLALRLPWLERPLGGMDQVYRLHKWAGISAALAALLHWAADESSDWIKGLWGRAGRPAREAVLPWLTDARGFAKDLGEMAFYLLLAMVAITLLTRLLPSPVVTVLLTAVEGKSAAELLAHSPLALFDELGLRAQLSASRGQGLIALSDAVLDAARQAQA